MSRRPKFWGEEAPQAIPEGALVCEHGRPDGQACKRCADQCGDARQCGDAGHDHAYEAHCMWFAAGYGRRHG